MKGPGFKPQPPQKKKKIKEGATKVTSNDKLTVYHRSYMIASKERLWGPKLLITNHYRFKPMLTIFSSDRMNHDHDIIG